MPTRSSACTATTLFDRSSSLLPTLNLKQVSSLTKFKIAVFARNMLDYLAGTPCSGSCFSFITRSLVAVRRFGISWTSLDGLRKLRTSVEVRGLLGITRYFFWNDCTCLLAKDHQQYGLPSALLHVLPMLICPRLLYYNKTSILVCES